MGDLHLGLLLDQPQLIEPSDEFYLRPAAEVPFTADHVIDVEDPVERLSELMFSAPPTRTWR